MDDWIWNRLQVWGTKSCLNKFWEQYTLNYEESLDGSVADELFHKRSNPKVKMNFKCKNPSLVETYRTPWRPCHKEVCRMAMDFPALRIELKYKDPSKSVSGTILAEKGRITVKKVYTGPIKSDD